MLAILLIVRPHSKHLHNPLLLEHLIDQTVLNIDPSQTGASQVADQFLVGWRGLERVLGQNCQQGLGFFFQSGGSKFFGILLCVLGVQKLPTHQASSLLHSSGDAARPSRIDSRMPGTERRYRVS